MFTSIFNSQIYSTLRLRIFGVACAFHALLLAVCIAAPAAAAPKKELKRDPKEDEAEQLIQQGIKLRRVGRDDAALERFDRAFNLVPSPRAAAQKGLCLQALGRFTEAEDLLANSLEGDGDPWVQKNRSTIKDSLEDVKTKIGRFEISGTPLGAQVLVDGRVVGQLPLQGMVRINAGPATLEVQADGYIAERNNLAVEGASFRRLEFRLKKDVALVAAPLPANEGTAEAGALSVRAEPIDSDAEGKPVYKKAWFWGVVGATVVAGVVAAVLLSGGQSASGPMANEKLDL